MRRLAAGASVAVLGFASCGSSQAPPTAMELADRLVKAGLCHDAVPGRRPHTATCADLSFGLLVAAFPTHRQLVREVAWERDLACSVPIDDPPSTYVAGRTWLVAFPQATERTARTLGGRVMKLKPCPPPKTVQS